MKCIYCALFQHPLKLIFRFSDRPIAAKGRIPTGGVDSVVFSDEYKSLGSRSISTDSNDSHGCNTARHRKNLQPRSNVVFDDYSPFSTPEKPARKRMSSQDSLKTTLNQMDSSVNVKLERTKSGRVAPGGPTTIILG